MNILKNILGAFVEFKENDKANKPETAPDTVDKNSKPMSNNAVVSSTYSSATMLTTGTAYHKHFEDVMEEANASNPLFKDTDFKEFVDSKADLEAITDEPAKYRTAFNVLKRTGLTKERLVSTGQEYIKVIQRDLNAFENAYVQQYKADVENKEQLLQQKAQELQALNDKIMALNKEMKELSGQVMQSKDRLSANKASFVLAGENKKKEIKGELEKIEQYF